jgi:hypothetical protein
MDPVPKLLAISSLFLCLLSLPLPEASAQDGPIRLNDKGYFETRGFNVLAFENAYVPQLHQYHHLGDGSTMTDNLEYTYRGMDYIYGCHPYSNVSFVSGIGVHSKKNADGNNRADYSFIAGGVVPGVLVIPPDFPENKDDWPFFWGENEYVIDINAEYLYLVHAVHALGGADR